MTTASSIQLRRSTNSSNAQSIVVSSSAFTTNDGLMIKDDKYKKFIEKRECEEFLQKLKDFHKLKCTPINNYPTLNGKLIDLHALYQKVTSNGGWEQICENDKWDEIAVEFNIPKNCSNGSHALKIIYIRYLSLYEKINFFGADRNKLVKEDEEDESRRKFIHILKSVPMTYTNHNFYLNGGYNNSNNNISSLILNGGSLLSPSPFSIDSSSSRSSSSIQNYERLENSLTSGLPNEVDFVFNTILILSNDDSFSFRINGTNTRLVKLILANIGFFGDDEINYRRLYDQWRIHNNRNFVKFWHDSTSTDNKEILALLPAIYNSYVASLPSQEMMNLREENAVDNVEFKRIEQAMVILNNLSFDENNLDFLSKSTTLIQFLLVSVYCTYSELSKLSLDILSNISSKINLTNQSKSDLNRLFSTIKKLLFSNDRYEMIRSLEIIAKLCQTRDNKELLSIYLDNDIFEVLSELLTVQDFLLLTYGLECLYQLSQFNEIVCNQLILTSKSIISLLISYLTIDSTYFQTNSMKMIEIKQSTNKMQPTIVQYPQPNHHHHQQQTKIIQQNQIITNQIQTNSNLQEQQAKVNLYNWFKTCFINNQTNQILKTELYCYYKYVAKMNNWITFSIPIFFELLLQAFPQLKIDDNSNAVIGLRLVVNNIQPQNNNNNNNNNSSSNSTSTPQVQIVQIKPQIVTKIVTAGGNSSNQKKEEVSVNKTLQLNINESSSSSTVSSISSSASTPQSINLKETRNSCDDDLNNIKENINFTKLNEKMIKMEDSESSSGCGGGGDKTTKNNLIDKLEKVGEAEPALNILCNNKNIKLSKIERLVNEVKTNGMITNGLLLSDAEEETTKSIINKNKILLNGIKNGIESQILINGHSDECDGINKLKPNGTDSSSSSSTSSITDNYVNGFKLNGNSSKIVEKIKKRKQSTDSSTSQSVKDDNNGIILSPVKKRQKKINEMDIPVTPPIVINNNSYIKSDSNSSINKILVNNNIQNDSKLKTIIVQQQPINNNSNDFLCEWDNCNKTFTTVKEVYNHLFKNHLFHLIRTDNNKHQLDGGSLCLWSGCDQIKRQRWSLVSHLQEHCSEQSLRNAVVCRQKNLKPSTPAVVNPQIAYSKDAALLAIYRSQRPAAEEFLRGEDASVVKSIRLLAALCLRNLATNCPLAKRSIRQYESVLSNIAFDILETSNAISNCLWQLSH